MDVEILDCYSDGQMAIPCVDARFLCDSDLPAPFGKLRGAFHFHKLLHFCRGQDIVLC